MSRPRLFIITASYEAEQRLRDEFGWVQGHGPGNGRYKAEQETLRLVAPDEEWARSYVTCWFGGDGIRNVEITNVESHHLDAVISVDRY